MQDALLHMTMTPRCHSPLQYVTLLRCVAKLVEDAASVSSAHSRRQTNGNVPGGVCVVSNSVSEMRVCNSGAIEPLIVLTSTLSASMGAFAHDHELLPKHPTELKPLDDNAAVSYARLQTQRFSYPLPQTRIKPPLWHPLMMIRTCSDVRRLFAWTKKSWTSQWFETVTWDSIKDLRGTTYVQPPPRIKFALQQPQHAILRPIMHNNPSSLASEPARKVLVLSSWLLLGRPAVNASESSCAARTTWKPGSISSGLKICQPFGLWYVLSVTLPLSTVQHAEQQQNKNSHASAR